MTKFRFGLRSQLLLPSSLLLLLPILGQAWIDDWTLSTEQAQKANMQTSARTISQVLAVNPDFRSQLSGLTESRPQRDLYSQATQSAINLDGRKDDWGSIKPRRYNRSNLVEISYPYTDDSLSVELSLAANDKTLYMFIQVADDRTVYREISNRSVHRNDHVQIALLDPNSNFHRYTIATRQPAGVIAHSLSNVGRSLRREPRIYGVWVATATGYNVELQLPISMVGEKLAIAVADVDDPVSREIQFVMGSASTLEETEVGNITITSSALIRFLNSFPDLRVTLVDKFEHIVAQSQSQDADTTDRDADGSVSEAAAATGDKNLLISFPFNLGGTNVGTLIVEQSNAIILQQRSQAMTSLLAGSLLIISASLLAWFALSTVITRRLHRLRTALETAVDQQGRVSHAFPGASSRDEIGDLSRSFAGITNRLQQYNQYLEGMARRLAHELRTPITVIRSSLENLTLAKLESSETVYVERAHQGVERLTNILNKMSEATRLEQTLDNEEIEPFDLTKVVRGCVEGYQSAFEKNTFLLSVEAETVMLIGIPELMVQLLDKLVANAVEFSDANDPIKLRLTVASDEAVLRVFNDGPSLPEEMADQLFDSMVSVREVHSSDNSHLGLGLYIAKVITEFHGGTIDVSNREDTRGVIVTVRIPIMRLSIKLRS